MKLLNLYNRTIIQLGQNGFSNFRSRIRMRCSRVLKVFVRIFIQIHDRKIIN